MIGLMKDMLLSHARDTFLFDCQAAGLDPQTRRAFRDVLSSFTRFTGNMLVRHLTPDHVRFYISNLSDGHSDGEENIRLVKNHYAVIHTWIRWLHAQKFITERGSVKPPRWTNIFRSQFQRGA